MKLLYYPWVFLFVFVITFPFGVLQNQYFSAAVITNLYMFYFLGFQFYAINKFEGIGFKYAATTLFGVFFLSSVFLLAAHPEWGGYQFPETLLPAASAIYVVSALILFVMGSAALNRGLMEQGAKNAVLRVLIMNLFLMFTIFFFWGPLFRGRQPAPAPTDG